MFDISNLYFLFSMRVKTGKKKKKTISTIVGKKIF